MEYSEETTQKLQQLQKKFIAELPERLSSMRKQWLSYVENGNDKDNAAFKVSLHNLIGSAGTFGYRELCEKIRAIEIMLTAIADNPAPSKLDIAAITAGIDDIIKLTDDMPDPGLFS